MKISDKNDGVSEFIRNFAAPKKGLRLTLPVVWLAGEMGSFYCLNNIGVLGRNWGVL